MARVVVQERPYAFQPRPLATAQRTRTFGVQIIGLQAGGQQLQGNALAPQRVQAVLPGAVEQLRERRQHRVRNRPVPAFHV